MIIPGTRIPVALVLAYVRDSKEEFISNLKEDFKLSDDEIDYALNYAIKFLNKSQEEVNGDDS